LIFDSQRRKFRAINSDHKKSLAVKNPIWLLNAIFAISASAQTNAVINFTNTAGVFIENAFVVKILPNKIFYLTASGSGMVRLGDLPPALQKKFGFNLTNAVAADAQNETEEQTKNQALYDNQLLASQMFQIEAVRHRAFQNCRIIWGRVVQKVPRGLIVDSGEEIVDERVKNEPDFEAHGNVIMTHKTEGEEAKTPGAQCKGLVFLVDYPEFKSASVGDYIQILAYRTGEYGYQPVSGGTKIVREFTADFDKAIAVLL
jgi:hypothetical protein